MPENGIPDVGMRQVRDALAVSAQEGRQVQIISGYRGSNHPFSNPNHSNYNPLSQHTKRKE